MEFKNILNTFRFKLIASLFLVVLLVLLSIYFVVNRTTESEFKNYVIRGHSLQLRGMEQSLLDYYERNGSWKGVESEFKDSDDTQAGNKGRGMGPGASGVKNAALVNRKGEVIASYNQSLVGEQVPQSALGQGVKLKIGDKSIGTLLAGPVISGELNQSGREFLESVNRTIVVAGAIGLLVALTLGWFLFRQLTRPLNKLTRATEKISSGNLDHRVSIESEDELRKLGESFNKMTKNLQESEEIRRRMIGDIAHELRTPLTVLSGEVEAIREGVYEPTDEKLREIQEDLNLLNRLVEDLQELTLAESGELTLNKTPTNMADLIRSVVGKLEVIGAEKGVKIKTNLPDNPVDVDVDGDRISQVLNNLVKNALSHTEKGDEVLVNFEEKGKSVLVEVADTGEGIPEEKVDNVFDRFYRADSSRSSGGGSGLGLSIAKELIEAHGGQIWIESEEGEGTKVNFSLPGE
ncbi:HAMP domain-containing protein [Candidatus Bipolaricaulota bacterium]|nr:HAMP domain-containing protein [Candidatus Bipolaricaulota bacterium]